MIIGIEAERANHPQKTGVEHYAQQLIVNLAQLDSKNQYVLYLRTKPQEWFLKLPKNFSVKVMPFPIFWTQLRISWEILFHPVDVLLIPASALPIIHPKKSVVAIHDLAWKFYPETFTWFNRHFLNWSTGFACRHASRIIAVSEATKNDLIKFYNIKAEKIEVIYHGYDLVVGADLIRPTSKAGGYEPPLQKPYILFLSTLQPRKNLEGLVKACRELKSENPDLFSNLVVVGKPGWKFDTILKTIDGNKGFVDYRNHVSELEKAKLLIGAAVLALPSFYEGFGMTILEAFAAGTPVATSNVSSMPEVAGDAAVYFDPHDINSIKTAIKNILADKCLADSLRSKGWERLKNFSWEKCARETLQVLQK